MGPTPTADSHFRLAGVRVKDSKTDYSLFFIFVSSRPPTAAQKNDWTAYGNPNGVCLDFLAYLRHDQKRGMACTLGVYVSNATTGELLADLRFKFTEEDIRQFTEADSVIVRLRGDEIRLSPLNLRALRSLRDTVVARRYCAREGGVGC